MECYKPSNTNFDRNGDIKLQPSSAILKVELNGICEIEIEHSYDKENRWKTIENLGVIKCDVCYSKNQQLFRIYDVEKGMFGVKVKARHIYFDLIDKIIVDTRAVNFNCETALNIILTGTKFKGHSDISLTNTAYFVKMNALSAISGDSDNTLLNRWGGEVIADNFDVYVNHRIGGDYGVKVKYSRNMLDIDLAENTDEIATRIYPQAYNGIMLPELYIDSPLVNKYPIIKERHMVFEDLKLKEDCSGEDEQGFETREALYEAMRQRVKEAFKSGLDKPKVSGKVDIAILENTEEYKSFKKLVNVGIGDTLTVEHQNIGVDLTTRSVGLEWDILNKKYNSITLGELNTDYFDRQDLAKEKLDSILNTSGNVKAESLEGVVSALNTKFQALRDIAQPQQVKAMLFEDRIKGSKTYGALALGSMGLMIANKRTLDNKDWQWNTFIGGGYVYADWLIGKLKTVLIENLDGSLQIDLSKTGGLMTKKNGVNAIELAGTDLNLYDWDGEGEPVGKLYSSRRNNNENVPGVVLANMLNSYLSLAYQENGTFYSYIVCDKHNIDGSANVPINVYHDVDLRGSELWLKYGLNSIFNSSTDNFVAKVLNNFVVAERTNNFSRLILEKNKFILSDVLNSDCYPYASFSPDEAYFSKGGHKNFSSSPSGFSFWINGNDAFYSSTTNNIVSKQKFYADGGLVVSQDFIVQGNKNCVQKTEKYGERLFYSVEDCESYLTDRSMHLLTVEEVKHDDKVTYERVVILDNIFKDSVNLDLDYTVEIIKQSWGDYRIKEQTKDYFIIESDRKDFTFKYVVTAKRQGFEEERNKEVFLDTLKENDLNNNIIENKEYWRLYTEKEGDSIGNK
ncbi:phage structural protein [[Clostridium] sordellii]|uniref:phage tail spike protein n=1 Tax=Paraclostridium sordellii TaxID=1505 RepID=UPI0005DCF17D|nr:phage tail spike protein [Paeniclostridium sordellii]CEN29833.1 phage structural protein [[Clostridium] sordellii] [Paeniclostridium sordellii]CEN30388.1 phage structural protein [[Clostridium] sordellii] [Paeniclostridium sordellii]